MKKNIFLSITLALCIGFTACDKTEITQAEEDTKSAALHNSQVQGVADDGFAQMLIAIASDDQPSGIKSNNNTVIISGPNFPKTITVTFDGTPDILGIVRTGSITGVLTNHFYLPNAQLTVDYNNYVVNGVQFKGEQTITNKNTILSLTSITFDVVVDGASVIVNNAYGKWTWSGNRKWEWTPTEVKITGTTFGRNEAGISYITKTTTPLIQKANCPLVSSGVVEITAGIYIATVDFGDGTCDDKAMFTFNGKKSEFTFFY